MEHKNTEDEDVEFVEDTESVANEKTRDIDKIKKALAECKNQRQEYLDGWQRAKADFINTKKRLEQELHIQFEEGALECISRMLPTLDSVHTALAHKKIDGAAREGLELIHKQILQVFKEYRVEEIDPIGEVFDPNFHEPIDTVSVEDKDQDERVQDTYQRGYKRGTKLIRPAKVRLGAFEK